MTKKTHKDSAEFGKDDASSTLEGYLFIGQVDPRFCPTCAMHSNASHMIATSYHNIRVHGSKAEADEYLKRLFAKIQSDSDYVVKEEADAEKDLDKNAVKDADAFLKGVFGRMH